MAGRGDNSCFSVCEQWPLTCGLTSSMAAVIMYAQTASTAQILQGAIPAFQLNACRFTCVCLLCVMVMFLIGERPSLEYKTVFWVASVSVLSMGMQVCLFTGFIYAPVGNAECVYATFGFIFKMILARPILREQLSGIKLIAVTLVSIGVMLILQPLIMFDFSHHAVEYLPSNTTSAPDVQVDTVDRWAALGTDTKGYVFLVCAGILYGMFTTVLKSQLQSFNIIILTFWCSLVNIVLSVIVMLIFETPSSPSHSLDISAFVLHCTGFAMLTLLHLNALCLLNGANVAVVFSAKIPVLVCLQYTLLKQYHTGHDNVWEKLGIAASFVGLVLTPVMFYVRNALAGQEIN